MPNDPIGYKLTFCKKLSALDNPVPGVAFEYLTLAHFDGIFINEIKCVSDYKKTCSDILQDGIKWGDLTADKQNKLNFLAHCEKQVVNIITENVNNDVLSNHDMPIMVVTLLNFSDENNCRSQKINSIKNALQNYIGNLSVDFGVYMPLSIEDLAIVFKSYTLESILKLITNLRNHKCFADVMNMYSVISLDTNSDKPAQIEEINTYIKIQAVPPTSFREIADNLPSVTPIGEERNYNDTKVAVGKYDMYHRISIKNTMNYYFNLYRNILDTNSCISKKLGVLSTETIVIKPLNESGEKNHFTNQFAFSGNINKQKSWNEWYRRFEECWNKEWDKGNKSETKKKYKEWFPTLYKFSGMLSGRAHRISHAVSSYKYFEPFWEFISEITKFIPEFIKSESKRENYNRSVLTVSDEIRSLITGIDDVFSTSFHDFEQSQKDGLCVHSAGKLMVAYRNFAEFLGNQLLSVIGHDGRHIYFSIVSAITETTKINRYDIKENKTNNTFLTIHMPFSNIYDFRAAIFKICHEIGHLIYVTDAEKSRFKDICNEGLEIESIRFSNPKIVHQLNKILDEFYEEFAADYYAIKILGLDVLYSDPKHDKDAVLNQIQEIFMTELNDKQRAGVNLRFQGIRLLLRLQPMLIRDKKHDLNLDSLIAWAYQPSDVIQELLNSVAENVIPVIGQVGSASVIVKEAVKYATDVKNVEEFIYLNTNISEKIFSPAALYILRQNEDVKLINDIYTILNKNKKENSEFPFQNQINFFKSYREHFFDYRSGSSSYRDDVVPFRDFLLAFTERRKYIEL
ncbi:MAG: hypothetical protein LBM59_07655 [Ruminococcus sp.]|jgi:hypothetical protein|nr:hypothetical protein [Ruminococcus sp.]